jgi:pyrimidine deaminase RibD-like protein
MTAIGTGSCNGDIAVVLHRLAYVCSVCMVLKHNLRCMAAYSRLQLSSHVGCSARNTGGCFLHARNTQQGCVQSLPFVWDSSYALKAACRKAARVLWAQLPAAFQLLILQLTNSWFDLCYAFAGVTAPHPNAACILVSPSGQVVGSACHRAQGTTPSEVLAVQQAREAARGATAYLNLETGDCHGDESAVAALVGAGVSRVVVGLRHPLAHLR